MGIDFDSFLNSIDQENEEKSIEKITKEKKVDLEFQKDVEDKINEVSGNTEKQDFVFLEKMYNEIKKFEVDLPNKFLGIKSTGNEALKKISNKYSDEFLKSILEHVKVLRVNLDKNLNDIKLKIDSNEFDLAIKIYDELLKLYNLFPKEYAIEKIDYGTKIKQVNIVLNQRLKIFKLEKLKLIRKELSDELKNLYLSLKPGNSILIEEKIKKVQDLLREIPNIFSTEIIDEKISISNSLIKAENYLKNEYRRDFEERKEILFSLFENFQKQYVNKNLDNALTIYDEVIIEFEKIPEVFLDQKIQIYKQINNLYTSLNNLVMSNSISTFLRTYSYGKTIDEVKDYLRHVKTTRRADYNTLNILKKKLSEIPNNIEDKKKLLLKVNELLNESEKEKKKIQNEKEENNSEDLVEIKDELLKLKNENKLSIIKLEEFKQRIQKNPSSKTKDFLLSKVLKLLDIAKNGNEDIETKIKSDDNENLTEDLGIGKNVKANKKIIEEINLCFSKMKNTNEKNELKMLYKKILFYLNVVHFKPEVKKNIIQKVNKELQSKKIM